MSKYNNKRVMLDGINFQSQREATRYAELKLLERAKVIKDLKLQPRYVLQDGFTKNGKRHRPITYIADFEYYDNEKQKTIIEDVKGYKTEVFKIKQKIFEFKYPDKTIILT